MKKSDNTTLYIVIGIFVTAIIIGTIIGSSYNSKERFANPPNKLVYLYMDGCGHCAEFNTTWENIKSKVEGKAGTYNFTVEKYDLGNGKGSDYAKQFQISYAPAILFIKGSNPNTKNEYNGSRTVDDVLKWASSQ
jgi:hypothetical protein